jgi:two-component system response regulator FlrC
VIGCADLTGQGLVRSALEAAGHPALALASAAGASEAVARGTLAALVIEASALDADVRELLCAARERALPALLVARDARVATAVAALRLGATDYLAAPFELESLQRALERLAGARFSAALPGDAPFVTRDPETLALLELLRGVAPSDATVLIEGESGTGKELLAQLVHRGSPRRPRELVSINCAALPAGLLESELFGHERGAFTGALARSLGKFELAHGSTLLLDEIGELELGLQAKLLRVLQEREVLRLGARRPVSVDFRLVATTNRSLREEVRAGRFREDLFYRLCVLPIRLRPLRERPCDVQPLLEHFLGRHARAGRALPLLLSETRAALERHAWPGNARELENLVERLVLTHAGRAVAPEALDLPGAGVAVSSPTAPGGDVPFRTLREMERWLIAHTLRRLLGNRTQAARELGIGLRTLRNKIREYRIDEPDTLPRSGLGRIDPLPAATAHPAGRERTPATAALRERPWHVGCSDVPRPSREV